MPDFNRYTNTDINTTRFESIVFGSGSPILEVELNEAQLLMHKKTEVLANIIGNCVNSDFSIEHTKSDISSNCVVNGSMIIDGYIIRLSNQIIPGTGIVYIDIQEQIVTSKDDILDESGNSITNTIVDDRFGNETTRRKYLNISFNDKIGVKLCEYDKNGGVILHINKFDIWHDMVDILSSAKQFTKDEIAKLINGAPESADTLRELADLINEHKDVMDALDNAIGKKADKIELDKYVQKKDVIDPEHGGTGKTNLYDAGDAIINSFYNADSGASLTDNEKFITDRLNNDGVKRKYLWTLSKLWDWIKSKLAGDNVKAKSMEVTDELIIPSKPSNKVGAIWLE